MYISALKDLDHQVRMICRWFVDDLSDLSEVCNNEFAQTALDQSEVAQAGLWG